MSEENSSETDGGEQTENDEATGEGSDVRRRSFLGGLASSALIGSGELHPTDVATGTNGARALGESSTGSNEGWNTEWSLSLSHGRTELEAIDSDGDGTTDLAVSDYTAAGSTTFGIIEDGSWVWNRDTSAEVRLGAPGDVTGDGTDDYVFVTRIGARWIAAYDHNGTSLWRTTHPNWVDYSAAVDMDADGKDEALVVSITGGDTTMIDDDGTYLVRGSYPGPVDRMYDTRPTNDGLVDLLTAISSKSPSARNGVQLSTFSESDQRVVWEYGPDDPADATFLQNTGDASIAMAVYRNSGDVHWIDGAGNQVDQIGTSLSDVGVEFFDTTGDGVHDAVLWSGSEIVVVDGSSRETKQLSMDSTVRRVYSYPDRGIVVVTEDSVAIGDPGSGGLTKKAISRRVWDVATGDIDGDGNSEVVVGFDDQVVTYEVDVASPLPTASFTTSIPGTDSTRFDLPEAGESINFDASSSSDSIGTIDSYEWDFDADGAFESQGVEVEHKYNSVGKKSPTLQVTNGENISATTTRSLTVGLPGRRRTRQLAYQIDSASVHSDIESITGEQLDGALELATPTLDALREAVVDGRVDPVVAEDAITRLQSVENVSRDLVRRLGPAGDDFLARQLVRKAVEAAAALVVVAISMKVGAAVAGGTAAAVVVGGTVGALLDAASFVLGDWLAPNSGGNSSYRQQTDRDLRDGAGDIIDDVIDGEIPDAETLAAEINNLVDTLVETAADGLRTVIELNLGDTLAEIVSEGSPLALGAGNAVYRSLDNLNRAFSPSALETGLQGTTRAATSAVTTGRSQLFVAIDTTSRFIENLSELSADFTSVSETIVDAVNGDISAVRGLAELGGTLLAGLRDGIAGAVVAVTGAAVGAPLVTFIKTIHEQIVQSAIQGESVGFTSL
jgi:hypothetical protein